MLIQENALQKLGTGRVMFYVKFVAETAAEKILLNTELFAKRLKKMGFVVEGDQYLYDFAKRTDIPVYQIPNRIQVLKRKINKYIKKFTFIVDVWEALMKEKEKVAK